MALLVQHILRHKSGRVSFRRQYARVRSAMVARSIFNNRRKNIVCRDSDLERLGDVLPDLWDAEEPNKRWAEIEYLVQSNTFEVAYTYADEIDPEEDTFERRDRIVKRYFRDKANSLST